MSPPRGWDLERLGAEELSQLIALGESPTAHAAGHLGRRVLPAVWREHLPADATIAGLAARNIPSILAAADTPLRVLIEVKRAAKGWIASTTDLDRRQAMTLLYQAVVAAAYFRHGVLISSRPIGLRIGLYDSLATSLADDDALAVVFRGAVDRFLEERPRPDAGSL